MKQFCGALIIGLLAFSLIVAQDAKTDAFNKIVKLSASKKQEDKDKAYTQSKDFLTKFGKDTDEKVKKIKDYVDSIEIDKFNVYLNQGKTDEAFLLGKELVERFPEDSYLTMNLALGGMEAFEKRKDDSFGGDSINFAKQTLKLFEAGKLPKTFQPIKDQSEASAIMHYIIGTFTIDVDPKAATISFLESTKFESKYKNSSIVFYQVTAYYEGLFETATKEFQVKHGLKNKEDAEMKADTAKIDVILDRMIDAYARTVKYAEAEKSPNLDRWKARLTQVYTFRKKSNAGLNELLNGVLNTQIPEIL